MAQVLHRVAGRSPSNRKGSAPLLAQILRLLRNQGRFELGFEARNTKRHQPGIYDWVVLRLQLDRLVGPNPWPFKASNELGTFLDWEMTQQD